MDAETFAAIDRLTARLNAVRADVAERIRWLSEHHEREWKDAAAWRTQWTTELDAIENQVTLLITTVRALQRAQTMPTRDELLGNDLTQTIEQINQIARRRVPPTWVEDVDLLFRLFGDFWAHTLGRATVLAAGAVRAVDEKVEALGDRVAALEAKQVGDGER